MTKEYYFLQWHEYGDEECMSTSSEFDSIEELNKELEEISHKCDYVITCELRKPLKILKKSFRVRK